MSKPEIAPINDIRSYIAALDAHGILHRVKTEVEYFPDKCSPITLTTCTPIGGKR